MTTFNLLLGTHYYQPVGTPDYLIEQAYRDTYFPFLKTLKEHPKLKVTCYFGGYLLEWLEKYHDEFIVVLKSLLRSGQVELLGGGYYDPIFPIISSADRQGQIKLLTERIKKMFGVVPAGVWLPEQVFSPVIQKDLVEAGIEYVFLDSYLMPDLKLDETHQFLPLLLDYFGQLLKALPVQGVLTRATLTTSPEKMFLLFKKVSTQLESAVAVLFGNFIFSPKFLDSFLTLYEANATWLNLGCASAYLEAAADFKKVYVREGAKEAVARPAGGAFQNYFSIYPQANQLYKKMLNVSEKIQTLRHGNALGGGVARESNLEKAALELYQAQVNDAYFPKDSGGIYLKYIREEAFAHLIAAEKIITALTRGDQKFSDLSILDFDGDLQDEVLISNDIFNAYVSPGKGGALFELDYKPKCINLVNSFADTATSLRKAWLADYVMEVGTTADDFRAGRARKLADFATRQYLVHPVRRPNEISLKLSREADLPQGALVVHKSLTFYAGQSQFLVEYEVKNAGEHYLDFTFGVEFALTWINDKSAEGCLDIEGINRVRLFDAKHKFSVLFTLDKVASIWRYPIETAFTVLGHSIKTKQGIVILPNWKLSLPPKTAHTFAARVVVEE